MPNSTRAPRAAAVVSPRYLRILGNWIKPSQIHSASTPPSAYHHSSIFNEQLLQHSAPPNNNHPTEDRVTTLLISLEAGLGLSGIRQVMRRHFNPPLCKENVTCPDRRFLILLELISHFHAKGQLSLINKFIIWCPGWHVLFVLSQARSTASSTAP